MKYIIFVILCAIISFVAFLFFRKLYRIINPRKCAYTMYVIDVGTI